MKGRYHSALLTSVALSSFLAAGAQAQDTPPPDPAHQTQDAGAPPAAPSPELNASGIQDIIVTARRSTERAQDVPVAVSVISPRALEATGVFRPEDLRASVPALAIAPQVGTGDRNALVFTIRGQGQAFGTLFPAVITYFNEVPVSQYTAGQFFDLENVQILRGPQGVLFGRVTDGGNVMIASATPKDRVEGYVETRVGSNNLRGAGGMLNIPIVNEKVLLRGAFELTRRDGYTKNIATGQDLDSVAYESYRVSLSLRPVSWLQNDTTFALQSTHDNGSSALITDVNPGGIRNSAQELYSLLGGAYGLDPRGNVVAAGPGVTPLTVDNYLSSIQRQLANQQKLGPRTVDLDYQSYSKRRSIYLVNKTTIDINDALSLINILGYTDLRDDNASNLLGVNGSLVASCHSACPGDPGLPYNSQEQLSEEVRLAGKSFGDDLSWSLGFYTDRQRPGVPFQNHGINLGIMDSVTYQSSRTTSVAGFAYTEWNASKLLPGLKFNGGVRYTRDTVRSDIVRYLRPVQVDGLSNYLNAVVPFVLQAQGLTPAQAAAAAPGVVAATIGQPTPFGQCTSFGTGGLFPVNCTSYESAFNAFTWSGGASYQFATDKLVYAKLSRGYRPGGVNATPPPGRSAAYNPEYVRSLEVGLKATWDLGGDAQLRTNIAGFYDKYQKIQKLVVAIGPSGTPTTFIDNVGRATIKGVEVEATLVPVRGLSLTVSGSYTDAGYDKNGPLNPASCDATLAVSPGFCVLNRFANVPEWQGSINANYTLPLPSNIGRISLGGTYYAQSSAALGDHSYVSPSSIEPGYGLLSFNVTWSDIGGKPLDLTLFATNVTDKIYRLGSNDLAQASSVGVSSSVYGEPRMVGGSLRYRFGGA